MSKCKLQPKINLLSKEKKPKNPFHPFLLFKGKICKTKTVNQKMENSENDYTKKCKCKLGKENRCALYLAPENKPLNFQQQQDIYEKNILILIFYMLIPLNPNLT